MARALPLAALGAALLATSTSSAQVRCFPVRPRAPVAVAASADPAPVAASAGLTLAAAAVTALWAARRGRDAALFDAR